MHKNRIRILSPIILSVGFFLRARMNSSPEKRSTSRDELSLTGLLAMKVKLRRQSARCDPANRTAIERRRYVYILLYKRRTTQHNA